MTNIDVGQEKIQKQNPYIDFEKVLQQFNTPQLQCETDNGIATIPLADEISFDSWQSDIPQEYMKLSAEKLTVSNSLFRTR